MTDEDMDVWASDLRDKYGIAWPVTDEDDLEELDELTCEEEFR